VEDVLAEAPVVLVEQILGTSDARTIERAIDAAFPGARVFHLELSVGALFGLELPDGERLALKVHHPAVSAERLAAQQAVQSHLAANGFPCPRPVLAPTRLLDRLAVADEWRDEGEPVAEVTLARRRAMAHALARLVELAAELGSPAALRDPKDTERLWRTPHNALFDFEATIAGAEWIDEIAARAKPLMRAGPVGVGHHDWSVKHFRFRGDEIKVVYDWDSLAVSHESVTVGLAAATHTAALHLDVTFVPTVPDTEAFLDEYERVRSLDRHAARAAAVYVIAYTARCEHSIVVRENADRVTAARAALPAFAQELLP
jgi:Ser/Thr protein kinase RdoA (MazF antagonist)